MNLLQLGMSFPIFVLSLAAPTSNDNGTKTFGSVTGFHGTFVPEPPGRGTFRILLTCTSTFFFCVWTTSHPNIVPAVAEGNRLFYKFLLTVASTVVPETIMIGALNERRRARQIKNDWNSREENKNHQITLREAYFVVMGGFRVGKPHLAEKWGLRRFLSPGNDDSKLPFTDILTAQGFRKYLKDGRITAEAFDKASIDDKNKTSAIAKGVAIMQALYLVVGCASRWHAKLPVSLLEFHILIQVLRAAVIYVLWWDKPHDVNEPLPITLVHTKTKSIDTHALCSNAHSLRSNSYTKSTMIDSIATVAPTGTPPGYNVDSRQQRPNSVPASDTTSEAEYFDLIKEGKKDHYIVERKSPDSARFILQLFVVDVTQLDYPMDEMDATQPNPHSMIEKWGDPKSLLTLGLGTLVFFLTGAFHAALWNNTGFPTIVERCLWRGSAILMMFCPLTVFILICTLGGGKVDTYIKRVKGEKNSQKDAGDKDDKAEDSILSLFGVLGFSVTICVYFFAVSYVTVEAYLSLRYPFPNLYKTVSWTDYWPHI